MEPNMQDNIPAIEVKTIKTLIFVKNLAELADTKRLLGDSYDVLYENSDEDVEETVKRYIADTNLPQCHLHRWENEAWIGYHIFISGIKEV